MKHISEILEEILKIKKQISTVRRMKKENSEVWLRAYLSALNWVIKEN